MAVQATTSTTFVFDGGAPCTRDEAFAYLCLLFVRDRAEVDQDHVYYGEVYPSDGDVMTYWDRLEGTLIKPLTDRGFALVNEVEAALETMGIGEDAADPRAE